MPCAKRKKESSKKEITFGNKEPKKQNMAE